MFHQGLVGCSLNKTILRVEERKRNNVISENMTITMLGLTRRCYARTGLPATWNELWGVVDCAPQVLNERINCGPSVHHWHPPHSTYFVGTMFGISLTLLILTLSGVSVATLDPATSNTKGAYPSSPACSRTPHLHKMEENANNRFI